MTRFVTLPPLNLEDSHRGALPSWAEDFIEEFSLWYEENKHLVVNLHEMVDHSMFMKIVSIEFINEEEALLFVMRFHERLY